MKLTYILDYVFMQTPDGRIWTNTTYDATFWETYLAVYDRVTIVSRVQPADLRKIGWKEVESDRVRVAPLPLYRGAWEYLEQSAAVHNALRAALKRDSAVVLRMPSNLARCAAKLLDREDRPYAVEVVGDPSTALAPGVVQMTGRPLFRHLFTQSQRRICTRAIGAAYVAAPLRVSYPQRAGAISLVSSDVRLGPEWFVRCPRIHRLKKHLDLITVATLSQTYKGIDVLLRALSLTKQSGLTFSLNIVGEGIFRASLEELTARLKLEDSVTFVGTVPWGPSLIARLDAADIFVLPSRVEAMPRALLEAMARGLPAIATNVGAITELLDERYLVPPGNARQLADRLVTCVSRPTRLDVMSAANLNRADQYRADYLLPQWHNFHSRLVALFASHPQAPREPSAREPAPRQPGQKSRAAA